MKIECWQKRPTRIKAVELTEGNAQEVADWVGGEAHTCIETTNGTITISGTYDDMSHTCVSFVSSEDNKKNLSSRGIVK